MSGFFNYVGVRIFSSTLDLSRNAIVMARWPLLAKRLEELGHSILNIEHLMDWDITKTEKLTLTDTEFEKEAIDLLINSAKGDYDDGQDESVVSKR